MATITNKNLNIEIQKFGDGNPSLCFNCGNCTALCSISKKQTAFPRKIIRYIQLGFKNKLLKAPEPWLCEYTDDCNSSCPRGAMPVEIMRSTQKYLISEYDWTGLNKKFYSSKIWEFGSLLLVAMLVFFLFLVSGSFDRMETTNVSINTFTPALWNQFGILLILTILALLLVSNAIRMYYFMIVQDEIKISRSLYFTELKTFLLTAGTIKQWLKCSKRIHRLKNFVSANWSFLLLLFFSILTGTLLSLFKIMNIPLASYYMYLIHLMIVVPIVVIEVPFGKLSHMLYQPLATYFSAIKMKAMIM